MQYNTSTKEVAYTNSSDNNGYWYYTSFSGPPSIKGYGITGTTGNIVLNNYSTTPNTTRFGCNPSIALTNHNAGIIGVNNYGPAINLAQILNGVYVGGYINSFAYSNSSTSITYDGLEIGSYTSSGAGNVFIPLISLTRYNTSLSTTTFIGMTGPVYIQGSLGVTGNVGVTGNITASGNVTANAFYATSDYRIKDNITPLNDTYHVSNLNPVTYKNKTSGKQDIGLLAHELQEFYPELVSGEKDGETMQTINYISLIPILIKEVKTLKLEIKELKLEVETLKKQI